MNDNNSNNVIKDDSIINNDSNGQVTNNDAISDEQDISDNNIGNGYNSLASSNREAFTRGLNENYADRIARNKANLAQARARSNEAQKKGNDDELKDKNILDKAQDKANVLKNNASLLSSQIDSARSKAYQMMHPVEAAKIVAKRKLQKWAIGILISSLPMLLSIFVVFIACFYVLDLFGTSSATVNSSGILYESDYNYE